MTGRSDSDKIDPVRGSASGRLLFGAALVFAVGATLTLVFETNSQWLKLAVIAALWAAFFGAMLSVKYRHQAAARAGEVADLQAVGAALDEALVPCSAPAPSQSLPDLPLRPHRQPQRALPGVWNERPRQSFDSLSARTESRIAHEHF